MEYLSQNDYVKALNFIKETFPYLKDLNIIIPDVELNDDMTIGNTNKRSNVRIYVFNSNTTKN